MNKPSMPPQQAERMPSHRYPLRRDFFSANIVELGIALQKEFGTGHAARFMKDNWISIDVAMRVLLYPARRRAIAGINTDMLKLPEGKHLLQLQAL